MKDGCSFGKVTREKVDNHEEILKEIKEGITNINNHYSQRLPLWATTTIMVLMGLLGFIIGLKL